ncbi:DNA polymerase iota [Diplogelasinospora grovesii]|uniref:DNA polymerase iota n=1 Tax=Diplogelasinospora grovesii TaxID=303347 RepID=A0AAN6NH02_9PEZI|nr:DNA polymerase iota [Diplogelasinospora grovesii]
MEHPKRKAPRRKDDRIILHFDLDCFYAQCVENQQPALKSLPLGIKQKSILATCNYVARRRGVGKLMLISEAKKLCPELVVVEGEDLTLFRDVSKRLYSLLRSYSRNGKIERLGLDEMFLDVTDMVAYNLELLNPNALEQSFFCLSREDPEKGFAFDATSFAGCVHGDTQSPDGAGEELYMRLLLASHLGYYLRMKLEEDEGYTAACGISTNKLLAKLVGNKNKPRNQTTLLALHDDEMYSFMDEHGLRKVPGIGGKTTRVLEGFVLGKETESDEHTMDSKVTAGQVRNHPDISAPVLERLLGGPGSEKGIGSKVWGLLHGVDDSEVKSARDVPTQISIEDTYQGLNQPAEIRRELVLLSRHLLERMHVDLVEDIDISNGYSGSGAVPSSSSVSGSGSGSSSRRWIAYPKTIRLTTRPKTSAADGKPYNWQRASRSCPLPGYAVSFSMPAEQIVEKLVTETLLPMFRQLNPETSGWNIGLLNVCVTNMVGATNGGGNIATMFRRQEDVLREFTVYNHDDELNGNNDDYYHTHSHKPRPPPESSVAEAVTADGEEEGLPYSRWEEEEDDDDNEDDIIGGSMELCPLCGHLIPRFALSAHERFHSMNED